MTAIDRPGSQRCQWADSDVVTAGAPTGRDPARGLIPGSPRCSTNHTPGRFRRGTRTALLRPPPAPRLQPWPQGTLRRRGSGPSCLGPCCQRARRSWPGRFCAGCDGGDRGAPVACPPLRRRETAVGTATVPERWRRWDCIRASPARRRWLAARWWASRPWRRVRSRQLSPHPCRALYQPTSAGRCRIRTSPSCRLSWKKTRSKPPALAAARHSRMSAPRSTRRAPCGRSMGGALRRAICRASRSGREASGRWTGREGQCGWGKCIRDSAVCRSGWRRGRAYYIEDWRHYTAMLDSSIGRHVLDRLEASSIYQVILVDFCACGCCNNLIIPYVLLLLTVESARRPYHEQGRFGACCWIDRRCPVSMLAVRGPDTKTRSQVTVIPERRYLTCTREGASLIREITREDPLLRSLSKANKAVRSPDPQDLWRWR